MKKIISALAYLAISHAAFIVQNKLLVAEVKNLQYGLIKDFNIFVTSKTKRHGKKHFFRYCLQYISN